jgi:3' exoribonuclease, RNase T-like
MDVMLDIETLATSPDSVILTFGAIKFDPFDSSKEMTDGIYFRINVDEQIALGRHVDEGTVAWWGTQNEQVREEALGEHDRVGLEEFYRTLNKFVVGVNRIWAQGPVFDIVILENLYRMMGKPCPWPYYTIRDSRTLLKALGDDREGGALLHNALADAVSQAQAVQSAVKRYKLTEL